MNVDTGKISPQFHIIFDDKFETVVSLSSEDSLGDQLKAIFHLDRECYEDVDYNKVLSDLARQQLQLQVAQKTFTQISNLSIFNYIK
jgi:flagellar hook-associated protein 3 FlgL